MLKNFTILHAIRVTTVKRTPAQIEKIEDRVQPVEYLGAQISEPSGDAEFSVMRDKETGEFFLYTDLKGRDLEVVVKWTGQI